MLTKIWKYLLLALMFLLPWQTRLIYDDRYLGGGFWEYGSRSLYATEILLWIVIILFAVDEFVISKRWRSMVSKEYFRQRKNNLIAGILFFAVIGIVVFHSIDVSLSLEYFFHLLEGLCLMVIIARSLDVKKPLLISFWSAGVLQGALGIYQFFDQAVRASKWLGIAEHLPKIPGDFVVEFGLERWLRAYGGFGSPNILGGFLALTFIIGAVLIWQSNKRVVFLSGNVLILLGLLLSFSRSAWVATFLGFSLTAFLLVKSRGENKGPVRDLVSQLVFYGVSGIFLIVMLHPVFGARLNPNLRLEKMSITDRQTGYRQAGAIINRTTVLGVGPGAYTEALHNYNPKLQWFDLQPVHNVYYLIFAEWGIIGLMFWLSIFVVLILQIRRRNPIFLPLIMAMLIVGLFDHYLWSGYFGLLLWFGIFGLSLT